MNDFEALSVVRSMASNTLVDWVTCKSINEARHQTSENWGKP